MAKSVVSGKPPELEIIVAQPLEEARVLPLWHRAHVQVGGAVHQARRIAR